MKKIFFLMMASIVMTLTVSSCKNEETTIVTAISDLQKINLDYQNKVVKLTPVFGESDNCTYVFQYMIDGKMVYLAAQSPYSMNYTLSGDFLSIGNHVISTEYTASFRGTSMWKKQVDVCKYTIDEDGKIKFESAN